LLKSFKLLLIIVLGSSLSLTACSSKSAEAINVDVFLYDISGSGDSAGFSSFDRQSQLRSKFEDSFRSRTALYFDFVRKDFGRQQVSALIPANFFVELDKEIDSEIHDSALKKDTLDALQGVWENLLQNQAMADSIDCSSQLAPKVSEASGGNLPPSSTKSIARDFCSTVRTGLKVINSIPVVAAATLDSGIGSGIQGAIDRAIAKIESEETRILRRTPGVVLIPRLIVTSDFIENTPNFHLLLELEKMTDSNQACDLAISQVGSTEPTFLIFDFESDGLGSIRGSRMTPVVRQSLLDYWSCWLDSRGISEPNLGDRGIDWASL
jgi:hypothetical protein